MLVSVFLVTCIFLVPMPVTPRLNGFAESKQHLILSSFAFSVRENSGEVKFSRQKCQLVEDEAVHDDGWLIHSIPTQRRRRRVYAHAFIRPSY